MSIAPTHHVLSFLSSLFSRGHWKTSEFSGLPAIDMAEDPGTRDYRLLAGGLALLLSRCSEQMLKRDFRAALLAYRAIRMQLKRGMAVRLPSHLLSDLSHEIAQVADAATRDAARRCLQRNRGESLPAPLQPA